LTFNSLWLTSTKARSFWLALAVTQHKLGRLSHRVLTKALEVLDAGADLHRWQEGGPAAVRARTAVLVKIRAQITGPQPPRRTVRPPRRQISDLSIGQVLAYRAGSGRLHLMRIMRTIDTRYFYGPHLHAATSPYQGAGDPTLLSSVGRGQGHARTAHRFAGCGVTLAKAGRIW
jgi:hypothetical protein